MKLITKMMSVMLVLLLTSSLLIGQSLNLEKKKIQVTQDQTYDTYDGVKPIANPAFSGSNVNSATSDATRDVLVNNGPLVTHPAGGFGGADASALQSVSGPALTSYGFGAQQTAGNSIADDFTVTGEWNISKFKVFTYQTGSTTTSTITGLYFQIWSGAPNAGGTIVWGDLTTNRMTSTTWTNMYRSIETDLLASNRPIFEVVADISECVLPAGVYWIEWQMTGSLASGPWAPPISIWNQGETGNSLQYTTAGGWAALVSGPTASPFPQGLPFVLEGTASGQPNNDLAVTSILAPNTGSNLTSTETVTIRIMNLGLNSQSNFPVSYTINGGTAVTETVTATIASLATYDFSFATKANLSTIGTYNFHACSNLAGDQNVANNCFDKVVENLEPSYCTATTTTEDEYISNVLCGAINNTSGWQGGVADYTAFNTTILAGASEAITVTNGTPWASDKVTVWVDWNNDFTFGVGTNEEFILTNVGGTGASFTGSIAVPAGTIGGDHRMRIRMTYSTAPAPCGSASYGEIEDYTIKVQTSAPVPVINVNPMVLTQALDPDQTAQQIVTVSNTGTLPLTFDLAVNTANRTYHTDTPEDYARLEARMAADGINQKTVSLSHGKPGGASTHQTDETLIRYDDGVNADAIGLTSGGTFEVSAYWPAATMGQYSGMKLTKVEAYIQDVPNPCTIKIYGPGTSSTPGTLLYSQAVTPTANTWNVFTLNTQVDITGQDIWIGYEVTHTGGTYPAGCDDGPAIAGFGDMIYFSGTWAPLSSYGLNYNWNIVGHLDTGVTYTKDVGVQTILSPVSAPNLGNEIVKIRVQNYGTASQSNIPVSYTLDGGAPVTGTIAGPLAGGATVDFTFPGTVNLGTVGQTYVFNACTSLTGDENPANNCKTASVTNVVPAYCTATTSTEDEYIANVSMGTINNSSGWQGGVADYTAIFTTIEPGAGQDVTITNGTPWASDIVYIWVDWNKNYTFETGVEQYMLTNVGGTGATFTGTVTVPAGQAGGDYRMRIRMTYSTAPTPCGAATYGEVEDYTVKVGGTPPTSWLTATPLTGTVQPGQSTNITVTFNSAGLPNPSVHNGSLVFTSNDTQHPTVTVPVTLIVPAGTPPGPIFEDNFDAYTAGQQVACQNPTDWTTWSNAPCGSEDAYVSSLYAHSGANSAVIVQNNDLVKDFGDPYTTGKYSINFWAYIPTGKTGYFNTLQVFSAATQVWGLEVYFNAAGAGSINANGTGTATFTWTPGTWFKVEHIVNLDDDLSEIWIAGNMIYSYQWSKGATGTGQNKLEANDFFGAAATDQMFFDDYKLEDIGGPPPVGPVIAVNPTSVTQTVPLNQQADAYIAVSNTGGQPLNYSIEVTYPTAAAVQPDDYNAAEAEAVLAARMAADGISASPIALSHAKAGGVSPNQTDDEMIRYDDGVNADAIGLTSGGTFEVSAYWPAATMAQYAGMKLDKVEAFIQDVPNPCKLKIYGPGTSSTPGALLYEQVVTPTTLSWNVFTLNTQVDITGQDIWIGYEVTHTGGTYPAGCDDGPAIAGFGDMIYFSGNWAPLSSYGLNYNWNLIGYLVTGVTYTNDVGVQTILSPVSGPNLGNEVVKIRVKNSGTASQSNIPVSYTIDGGAPVTGVVAGPLAGGATFDYTFAGTVNMSNVGQTWVFNACTALAGDEAPANNCKTASVTNVMPVYCDATTSTEDEYIANVTMGTINNSSGWQGGVADYTAIYTEVTGGSSQDVTITNGTPWASDIVYIWVDWNKNYEFEGGQELTMLTNVGGTGATFTGSVAVPAGQGDGMYRMRIRMTYSTAPTPCGAATYGEIEDYSLKVVGGAPIAWLTVPTATGTVAPGATVNVQMHFNPTGLVAGTYHANLNIANNSTNAPQLVVPVTMIYGGAAGLVVNPTSLDETHATPPQTTTKQLTVTNTGTTTVNFTVVVNTTASQPEPGNTPEAEAILAARMAADGITPGNIELAPGSVFGAIQETDADYDLQFEYPTGNSTGEAGIETDGNFIYTTLWNGTQFCKYGLDGSFIGLFSVPGASAVRDLAYDGTYFYGAAAATTVFKMDFNTLTLVGTITAPTATRAIAYDEVADGFYGNNWSTPIVLYSRTGATIATIPTAGDESYYGFAYQPAHDGDPAYLWGYSQKTGTSLNMLYKLNLPAGTVAGSFDMCTILTMPVPGTDIAGGLYMKKDLIQGTYTLGGLVQNICLWGIEMGTTGPPPTVDVGVTAFVSPVSGPNLGNETVKITVKNFGANAVSNIPVSYTLDGGAAVTGTLAGPIAPAATADFTFPGTVNLSNPGQTFVFVGCTALAGDLNPNNNCKTQSVTHVVPTYCSATTSTEDEYIANVTMGTINNSSGWQGGVADYTAIYTTIDPGASQAVTITNGTPWASDIVYIWVDWNKNFEFEGGNELTMLTNVGGTGATFTGSVAVPASQAGGDYRMRIRMTYSTAPTPCGAATYGEVEDYTVKVSGAPPTAWLTAAPLLGTLAPGQSATITATFNSAGLVNGDYPGSIVFNSNAINPVLTVPVMLHVGGTPPCPHPAPTNLQAFVWAPSTVHLTWVAPTTPGGVIRWDNGTNNDGIGLTSGGTFSVAARWTGAQLAAYDGLYLTKVDLFPRSTGGTVFTLKVWKGANAATLVLSQPLTGLTQEAWNSINLSTAVQVSASTELWIGYECGTQPAGDYPAGCDAGPAVAGFGDMIQISGGAWAALSGYGLNYNWNLAGTIGGDLDGKPLAQPIVLGQSNNNMSYGTPVKGNLQQALNPEWSPMNRELMGYNVYRNGTKINSTIIPVNTLVYNDMPPMNNTYVYHVTGVYPDCESYSAPATARLYTEITEIENTKTAIYPNPATNFVNIKSGGNISRIMIMNNIGQVVYQTVADSQSIQVNTSDFRKGIYFIQVETTHGTVTEKLIIQ